MNKLPLAISLIALSFSVVSAQKLPQTQTAGVWAPQNLKIDGLANEWKHFQAYNKATNIFYTLSNDDANLYLVVQAIDPTIINKITTSGVTLTVEKPGNKIAVTFPAYDKENKAIFYVMLNAPTAKTATAQIDTFIQSHNQLRAARQKIIRVARDEKEKDISVYNEEGIKVAGRIGTNLAYTQELAIPLSQLGVTADGAIKYNICLNGQVPKGATIVNIPGRPDVLVYKGADGTNVQVGHTTDPDDLTLAYPTDLTGTYMLAKQ